MELAVGRWRHKRETSLRKRQFFLISDSFGLTSDITILFVAGKYSPVQCKQHQRVEFFFYFLYFYHYRYSPFWI